MKNESVSYYEAKKCFAGKNVLITGATGGIGSLLMASLAYLGAKVAVIVKDLKKLQDVLNDRNILHKYYIFWDNRFLKA